MKLTVPRCALLAALLVLLLAPAASAQGAEWLKLGVSGQIYSWQTGTC